MVSSYAADKANLLTMMNQIGQAPKTFTGTRTNTGEFNQNVAHQENQTDPPLWSRIIDVLSRPLYATANVVKDTIDQDPNTDNPLESIWAGLSGIDKTTGRNVIEQWDKTGGTETPDWVKGVGGFAFDVLADPLTYIPGAWVAKGVRGVGAVTGANKAITAIKGQKKLEESIAAGKGLEEYSAPELKHVGATSEPAAPGHATTTSPKADSVGDVANDLADPANTVRQTESKVEETLTPRPVVDEAIVKDTVAPTPVPDSTAASRQRQTGSMANDYSQATYAAEQHSKYLKDKGHAPTPEWLHEHGFDEMPTYKHEDVAWQRTVNDVAKQKEDMIRAGDYPRVRLYGATKDEFNDYAFHLDDVWSAMYKAQANGKKLKNTPQRYAQINQIRVPNSSVLQGAAKVVEGRAAGLTPEQLREAVIEQIKKADVTRAKSAHKGHNAERLADDLIRSGDELEEALVNNEKLFGRRDTVQGEIIGSKVADETKAAVNDPSVGAGEAIASVADVTGSIARQSKEAGLSPGGTASAGRTAKEKLGDTLDPNDVSGARTAMANAKTEAKGDRAATNTRQRQQAQADARLIEDDAKYVNLSDEYKVADILDGAFQRLYNVIGKAFSAGFRQGDIAHEFRLFKGSAEHTADQYNKLLGKWEKKYPDDIRQGAFTMLLSGMKPGTDITGQAMRDLRPLFDQVFDPAGPLGGMVMTRAGIDVDTLNEVMKLKGLNYEFKFEKGQSVADVYKQMHEWKIPDISDFLSKMQGTAMEISSRKSVANDWARRWGSKERKPGYVKIAKSDYAKGPMSHFIDRDLWYPRYQVHEMKVFNDMIDASTDFRNSKNVFGKFTNNVIDPYMRIWKPSVTIFRPGHHVRNFFGDMAMNYMRGVTSPTHYRNATAAMRAGGEFKGSVDELAKLFSSKELHDDLTRTLFHYTTKDGTKVPVTGALLYSSAYRNGTLIGYRSAEDILSSTGKGAVNRGIDRVMRSRPAQLAGTVSENNANFHKLSQLSFELQKKLNGKHLTLDEAVREANKEVLKYHPDVGGLAPLESKYGRRAFSFYTWMRQAIPRIASATLYKPGRAITPYSKAFYNFQVGMGMDPESMQEPFTNEGLLPSYIREYMSGNFGVGGTSFVANLGTPTETMNDLMSSGEESNPFKTVANFAGESLNPLAGLATVFATDSNIAGKYEPDKGEVVDKTLPILNQIAAISGYSPTGSVTNLFSGTAGPVLDPQRSVEAGRKEHFLNTSLLNWITGLGIQPVGTAQQTKFASRENRSG